MTNRYSRPGLTLLLVLVLVLAACERPLQQPLFPSPVPADAAAEGSVLEPEEAPTAVPEVITLPPETMEAQDAEEAAAEGDELEGTEVAPAEAEEAADTEDVDTEAEQTTETEEEAAEEKASDAGEVTEAEETPSESDDKVDVEEAASDAGEATESEDETSDAGEAAESQDIASETDEAVDVEEDASDAGEATHTEDIEAIAHSGSEEECEEAAILEEAAAAVDEPVTDEGSTTEDTETEADSAGAVEPLTHVVAAGENLYRIGQRYGIAWEILAAVNHLVDPRDLQIGQVLVISAEPVDEPEPAVITYVVRLGDTLFRISLRFGVDWHAIAEENGLEAPYVIYPGDELVIPGDP